MTPGTTTLRRLGAAAGLTLAVGMLAACGNDAPDNASVEDFCDSVNPEQALEGMDLSPDATEDEQKDAIEEALNNWRDELEETGTPEDISDEAREGFEELLEEFDQIDFEQSLEDIGAQLDELDEEASDNLQALETYVEEKCDVTM